MSSKHCLCYFVYIFAVFIAKMLLIYDRNKNNKTRLFKTTRTVSTNVSWAWHSSWPITKQFESFPRKINAALMQTTLAKCILHNKHPIILLHAVKFRWIVKWENKTRNFWRVFYPLIFFINSRVYTFYLTTVWLFNIVLSTPFSLF